MASFALGQKIRITATFKDENGAEADPSAVYCQIKDEAGTVTSYQYTVDPEVVKDNTGIYHLDVDLDAVGWWYWRWYSTGNYQAANEGRIRCQESEFD